MYGAMAVTLPPKAPDRSLTEACGLPLWAYRREHLHGCVVKAMRREQVPGVTELAARIDRDPPARERLRRSIAVATSGLFRDPDQLRFVDRDVLPSVTAGARRVRVWSAGCGAGEEAFMVAAMLEWRGVLARAEIVGSDVLQELLDEARTSVASGARIPAGLSGRVHWDLRDLATQPAPANDFDLVLCRDLITYLSVPAAQAVEATLASALGLGGIVVLGRHEVLERAEELGLSPIAPNAYRRVR
jgi:chemotaxis protein methyltransferase CheR